MTRFKPIKRDMNYLFAFDERRVTGASLSAIYR